MWLGERRPVTVGAQSRGRQELFTYFRLSLGDHIPILDSEHYGLNFLRPRVEAARCQVAGAEAKALSAVSC